VSVRFDPFFKFLPAAERIRRLEKERQEHEEMVAEKMRRLAEERYVPPAVRAHREKFWAVKQAFRAAGQVAPLPDEPGQATALELDRALLAAVDLQGKGGGQ
jgi:hypothetical protein